MIRTITPTAMRQLETDYMREKGIPGILLMEQAAAAVANAIAGMLPSGGTALFLCGPGNNGGDGYASARIWKTMGGESLIWELSDKVSVDAAINRTIAIEAGICIEALNGCPDRLPPCDLIVDALFGTGLSREPEGAAAELIDLVNRFEQPVIAVDIPSGLNGTTGKASVHTVRAQKTVTFHRPKDGLYLRDGCVYAGEIISAPILIPPLYGDQTGLRILEPSDVRSLLPARPVNAHKGTFGHVVLLAGSSGMAGAAAFCAKSCLRTGAGLVTVLCPVPVLPVLQSLVPEAMCIALSEDTAEACEQIQKVLSRASRAAVGCGISANPMLIPLLRTFREAECPVVWDADALNLLAANPALLPLKAGDVITPHPAEAARLLQCPVSSVLDDPLGALHNLQTLTGACVLLKGARTLMTDGNEMSVNPIGTPALAKGGSGDILTGMLTALIGRTGAAKNARLAEMQLASYLHVRAAERAASLRGEDCVLPEDIIDAIRFE